MSAKCPTHVFVCDICATETVVPFDPEIPAYITAKGNIISIGSHHYEAGPCCTRGVWRYLAYIRRFSGGPMPGGFVGELPYIFEPSAEEKWSPLEEKVMAEITEHGPRRPR